MSELAPMSLAHASNLEATVDARPEPGGRAFLSPTARSARCRELAAQGFLVARVVPVSGGDQDDEPGSRPSWHGGPLRRGGLREALEGAVEISLALRGALPPSVEVDAPVKTMAHDQLFRVRTLSAAGLCVVLPSLAKLADDGVLNAADSGALMCWRQLSASQPVWLLFDEGDRSLQMLAPATLADTFGVADAPPRWSDDAREMDGLDALEALADFDEDEDDDDDDDDRPSGPVLRGRVTRPELDASGDAAPTGETSPQEPVRDDIENDAQPEALHATDSPGDVCSAWHGKEGIDDAPAAEPSLDEAAVEDPRLDEPDLEEASPEKPIGDEEATRPLRRVMADDPLAGIDDLDDHPAQASLFETAPQISPQVERFASHPPPPPEPPPMAADDVERACEALEEARGPKPVKAIEQLFRTRYAPLAEAVSRGLQDQRAEDIVEEWRESFEHSYGEGFNTMRVTGRRPTMVLDVPEVATRIGKLNGARTVQLLLVDAMRYDLGRMVQTELKHRLESHAVCVEETLMWSALPTVTPVQMHLLARGAAGLRDPEPQSERDPIIHRDGSLTTLRRVRIGPRDLVKLDIVEARLREPGRGYHERMSSLADEVGDVIARYAESLPPRTLLFVFGDHGFHLPIEGPHATGPAEQGGATPEEALVGGWAWLVDDTH
jgi:hypothetical protein